MSANGRHEKVTPERTAFRQVEGSGGGGGGFKGLNNDDRGVEEPPSQEGEGEGGGDRAEPRSTTVPLLGFRIDLFFDDDDDNDGGEGDDTDVDGNERPPSSGRRRRLGLRNLRRSRSPPPDRALGAVEGDEDEGAVGGPSRSVPSDDSDERRGGEALTRALRSYLDEAIAKKMAESSSRRAPFEGVELRLANESGGTGGGIGIGDESDRGGNGGYSASFVGVAAFGASSDRTAVVPDAYEVHSVQLMALSDEDKMMRRIVGGGEGGSYGSGAEGGSGEVFSPSSEDGDALAAGSTAPSLGRVSSYRTYVVVESGERLGGLPSWAGGGGGGGGEEGGAASTYDSSDDYGGGGGEEIDRAEPAPMAMSMSTSAASASAPISDRGGGEGRADAVGAAVAGCAIGVGATFSALAAIALVLRYRRRRRARMAWASISAPDANGSARNGG